MWSYDAVFVFCLLFSVSTFTAYAASPQEKKTTLSVFTKPIVTAFKDIKWRKNFINFKIYRVKVREMPQGLIKRQGLDV